MDPDRKLTIVVLTLLVVVSLIATFAVPHFTSEGIVVPAGTYVLPKEIAGGNTASYWTSFSHKNNETAQYYLTGAWSTNAPTQVIVGISLGLNFGGCGFTPVNYPSGPLYSGCWPDFEASPNGAFRLNFHVCVGNNSLPTGSFVVIFRSASPATVIVTEPFRVQESSFPQAQCLA